MMAKMISNTMSVSLSAGRKQAQEQQPMPMPVVRFPGQGGLNMGYHKEKIVIVMGATGTGKSRLAIDLATHFPAEIVNSDKIQVYNGLNIVTNKVTAEECRGVPHHLLGIADPHAEFTSTDFCHLAKLAIGSIIDKDRVPIIAGGSNSLINTLVNSDPFFNQRYECCFLWVDVSLPVLRSFVSERVDRMVRDGMIDEVREIFYKGQADYTRGIRRAIGVPEMHRFLEAERNIGSGDKETLSELLDDAIDEIKVNTYKLACKQLQKILRLRDFWGWDLNHIDATQVFLKRGRREEADEAWEDLVVRPSTMIVNDFLSGSSSNYPSSTLSRRPTVIPKTLTMAAAASY